MSDFTPVIVFVSVILFFVTVQMYNSFIKYRNQIEEEWSGIDVALKRRFNLIPNLVSTVQSYAKHEIGTMEAVTGQRSDTGGPGNLNDREAEESRVSRALNQVLAVAESYPDLKASANYLSLQNALNEVEAEILQARRRYNSLGAQVQHTGRVVSEQPDGETGSGLQRLPTSRWNWRPSASCPRLRSRAESHGQRAIEALCSESCAAMIAGGGGSSFFHTWSESLPNIASVVAATRCQSPRAISAFSWPAPQPAYPA